MSIYVNNTLAKAIWIKVDGVWRKCISVYAKTDEKWERPFINTVNITLSGLVKNYNVWDAVVAEIGVVTYPVVANVTLESGCNVVGTETDNYAFTAGDFPSGSQINLTLPSPSASITGRGGNGGYGQNSESYGGQGGNSGGHAIYTRTPIVIDNNGIIGSGGGGGAGGCGQRTYFASGNGGGGAGGYHEATTAFAQNPHLGTSNRSIPAGIGGLGAGVRGERNPSPIAPNGTYTTGGAGGASAEGGNSRKGGAGGDLGLSGQSTCMAGGATGIVANGYSYISFINEGTFVGRKES